MLVGIREVLIISTPQDTPRNDGSSERRVLSPVIVSAARQATTPLVIASKARQSVV